MTLTDDMMGHILNMEELGQAITLLKAETEQTEEIQKVVKKITYGINHKFHYKRWEKNMYIEKEKSGYIIIDKQKLSYEEVWDEIDDRLALAKRTLIEELKDEDPMGQR